MRELFPRRAGRGMVVLVVAPDRSVMSADHLLVWNARGLNSRARRSVVRCIVAQQRASIVCVQESMQGRERRCNLVHRRRWSCRLLASRICARRAPLLDHHLAHSSQWIRPTVVAH